MDLARLEREHYGVWYEVCAADEYRLRNLDFTPELIVDIGANVGSFTAHAKTLFPAAEVIAVEPNDANLAVAREIIGPEPGVRFLRAALGRGPVFWLHGPGPGNHSYFGPQFGYELEKIRADSRQYELVDVPTVMLGDLVAPDEPRPYIVKIDTEGAEAVLIGDEASRNVLRRAAYWAAEIHFYRIDWEAPETGQTPEERYLSHHGQIIRQRLDWIYGFCGSHDVQLKLWLSGALAHLRRRPEADGQRYL